MNDQAKIYKLLVIENILTILLCFAIIATIAWFTNGSLHCLWGFVVLLNLSTIDSKGL